MIALVLLACTPKPPPASATTPAPTGPRLSGNASWYGAQFAGRPTASGILFDPAELTAAHRTLAFGTRRPPRRSG